MTLPQGTRVDWFRLIVALTNAGLSQREQARLVGVALGTLNGWKSGAQPKHDDGERLIQLYCERMAVERSAVPTIAATDHRA